MKLITLNNGNQTKGRFTSFFREPITLNENSKVALLNASINIRENIIEVNGTNKRITIGIGPAVPYAYTVDIDLDEGVYTRAELVANLMNKLNSLPGPLVDDINGVCFNVELKQQKINITFGQTPTAEHILDTSQILSRNIQRGGAAPNGWAKTNGAGNNRYNTDSYLFTKYPFINGCGSFSGVLRSTGATLRLFSGTIIGLVNSNNPNDYITGGVMSFDETKYIYGLVVKPSAGGGVDALRYWTIVDGVSTNTNVAVNVDDVAEIKLINGTIIFAYTRGAAASVVLGTQRYIYYDANFLYGMISFYKTSAILENVLFTKSPFVTNNNGITKYSLTARDGEIYDENVNGGLGANINNYVALTLPIGTLKLLGFLKSPTPLNGRSGTYEAQRLLLNDHLPSNLKILLDDFYMSAYDGIEGARQNILMSIPSVNYVNSLIEYSRETPIFVSIENARKITLNRITARIVDFQNNEIESLPFEANLTLLFD